MRCLLDPVGGYFRNFVDQSVWRLITNLDDPSLLTLKRILSYKKWAVISCNCLAAFYNLSRFLKCGFGCTVPRFPRYSPLVLYPRLSSPVYCHPIISDIQIKSISYFLTFSCRCNYYFVLYTVFSFCILSVYLTLLNLPRYFIIVGFCLSLPLCVCYC